MWSPPWRRPGAALNAPPRKYARGGWRGRLRANFVALTTPQVVAATKLGAGPYPSDQKSEVNPTLLNNDSASAGLRLSQVGRWRPPYQARARSHIHSTDILSPAGLPCSNQPRKSSSDRKSRMFAQV